MKKSILLVAGCVAALLAADSAMAADYKFKITGLQTIEFALPSSPTPTQRSDGDYFRMDGVSGTVNGAAATFDLGFGSPTYFFNFGFFNNTLGSSIFSTGPALYTGTEASPTFKTGTFSLSPDYSVTIAAAVPEPATWAMLLTGFGAVGFVARRRNQRVRVTYAA